ncbi:His-Xaa-Ser system radical SAM maturase HxsC [Rhodobacter capsulatus]|uniref:His-Xaa-Ser system radical SAM maturase HxsC n=1 Tax=Rhodobacter capsulatus TaxID=1061 RepID=UPI004029D318
MIPLAGHLTVKSPPKQPGPKLYRLSEQSDRPSILAREECFLSRDGSYPHQFGACISLVSPRDCDGHNAMFLCPEHFSYLADGDIVRLDEHGALRVLFRSNAPVNHFLLTEQCDNLCLMCSQPPRNVANERYVDEISQILQMLPPSTKAIGFTGGEPTILGERFVDLVRSAKAWLPHTDLHVLSNGRGFRDGILANALAEVGHRRLSIGIPLHAPVPWQHDYIAQAQGAFRDTMMGLCALGERGIRTELRIVLSRQSASHLSLFADFIFRNLTFVEHVAFMGLEREGFAKANDSVLAIDPTEYRSELASAVLKLRDYGMNVSVYNLPACMIEKSIWPYACQSISDWKNEYPAECDACVMRASCCGFFMSGIKDASARVLPIEAPIAVNAR